MFSGFNDFCDIIFVVVFFSFVFSFIRFSDTTPAAFSVYRPYMVFFVLIDKLQHVMKVRIHARCDWLVKERFSAPGNPHVCTLQLDVLYLVIAVNQRSNDPPFFFFLLLETLSSWGQWMAAGDAGSYSKQR